jgi:hypothetical protein
MWSDLNYGAGLPATEAMYDKYQQAQAAVSPVQITTASGRVLSLVPGTRRAITVVSDPTGQYKPGTEVTIEKNAMAYASLAVEAANAVKANKSAMQVDTTKVSLTDAKAQPGTGEGLTAYTSGMDPMLKWTLIVGGTGVAAYGLWWAYNRYLRGA